MGTGVIVLARMDSRRLPGRPLRAVAGRSLIGHVLDRVLRVTGAPTVVVATTDRAIDDALVDYVVGEGFGVYRGAAGDAAGRCLACARLHQWTRFARVGGEGPFVDPGMVGRLIEMHRAGRLDLATNTLPRAYPAGTLVEVVATAALAGAIEAFTAADREQVTRFFYRHPERFRIDYLEPPPRECEGLRLGVEGPEDLGRAGWIMDQLGADAPTASFERVAGLAREWQGLRAATIEAGRDSPAA